MGEHNYRRLSIRKSFLILGIASLVGASSVFASTSSNQDIKTKQALSLKEKVTLIEASSQKLLPMPLGQLEEASKKVRSTRDPFQNTPGIESNNLEVLKSVYLSRGIWDEGN